MQRRRVTAIAGLAVVALFLYVSPASVRAGRQAEGTTSRPPTGLTIYGQTIWQLEALLHDTFGRAQVCLDLRRHSFVSSCGSFADYGYWRYTFAQARHSRFKLVRRRRPPFVANVLLLKVRGLYVYCGNFPSVGYDAYRSTRKWLVLQHGSADLPLTCA
jgi:hypothetical protein